VPRSFSSVDKADDEEAALTTAREAALKTARQIVVPWDIRTKVDRPMVMPETPKDIGDSETVVPTEHRERLVTIHRQPQTHMQSIGAKTLPWRLKWPETANWDNPLMGWKSSSDPHAVGLDLKFETAELAQRFCEKRGWPYEVEDLPPDLFKMGETTYAHNFLQKQCEGTMKKDGRKNKIWSRPKANRSNYFRPLTYTGEKPCPQHGTNPEEETMPHVKA